MATSLRRTLVRLDCLLSFELRLHYNLVPKSVYVMSTVTIIEDGLMIAISLTAFIILLRLVKAQIIRIELILQSIK
ncbi:hypothetical protein BH11BAC6_BH11BAC6_16380 [soil metagenome]